jgi:hypothetical protein
LSRLARPPELNRSAAYLSSGMNDLQPNESILTGQWVMEGDRVVADETCRRIEWLIELRLDRLANDSSGWETLYRDPRDGRLWEHTYPQSHMHGGGPPQIHIISSDVAASKYGVAA